MGTVALDETIYVLKCCSIIQKNKQSVCLSVSSYSFMIDCPLPMHNCLPKIQEDESK